MPAPVIMRLLQIVVSGYDIVELVGAARADIEDASLNCIEQVRSRSFQLRAMLCVDGPTRPGHLERLRRQQKRIEQRRITRCLAEHHQGAARSQRPQRIEEGVAADCVVDSCHSGAVGDGWTRSTKFSLL
jgi:hypothetical protein